MDLLGTLGVLVRVVETGSFSVVARERDLSQAAVARQISQLEEHFGVRLFHRTTRKLSLTDDGGMLLGLGAAGAGRGRGIGSGGRPPELFPRWARPRRRTGGGRPLPCAAASGAAC